MTQLPDPKPWFEVRAITTVLHHRVAAIATVAFRTAIVDFALVVEMHADGLERFGLRQLDIVASDPLYAAFPRLRDDEDLAARVLAEVVSCLPSGGDETELAQRRSERARRR